MSNPNPGGQLSPADDHLRLTCLVNRLAASNHKLASLVAEMHGNTPVGTMAARAAGVFHQASHWPETYPRETLLQMLALIDRGEAALLQAATLTPRGPDDATDR